MAAQSAEERMEAFTKSAARNIFYGGSLVFLIIFGGLTLQSHLYALHNSTDQATLTPAVVRGKRIWEKHACINCHTILGEGAYFAPELGNVWVRYGGKESPEAARDGIKAWIANQPTGVEGRRQMPNFHLSDQELNDIVDFLKWTSEIKTQNWPPNKAG
jgi:nitric oxide reductase subunit C